MWAAAVASGKLSDNVGRRQQKQTACLH